MKLSKCVCRIRFSILYICHPWEKILVSTMYVLLFLFMLYLLYFYYAECNILFLHLLQIDCFRRETFCFYKSSQKTPEWFFFRCPSTGKSSPSLPNTHIQEYILSKAEWKITEQEKKLSVHDMPSRKGRHIRILFVYWRRGAQTSDSLSNMHFQSSKM